MMSSRNRDALTYVQVDKASFDRCIARLRGDAAAMSTAVNRAVNKTATFAKTQIVRDLRKTLNLKPAFLREKYIRLSPATKPRPVAVISIKGTRIPLLAFGARQTARGVTYAIKRGGKRQLLRHGFINIGKTSGKPHVLLRVGELRPSRQFHYAATVADISIQHMVRPRYPVYKRYGPTLTQIMQTLPQYARGVFENTIYTRLSMELDRQVQVIIDRKDRKAG